MVTAIDRNGNERTFSLDIDRIIAMEEADPNYSFFEEMQNLGEKIRISALNRVCKAIGSDFKEMLSLGFGIEKIVDIFGECLRESGFISEKQGAQSSSTEPGE